MGSKYPNYLTDEIRARGMPPASPAPPPPRVATNERSQLSTDLRIARTTTHVTGRSGPDMGRGKARPLLVVEGQIWPKGEDDIDIHNVSGPIPPDVLVILGQVGKHAVVLQADLSGA